MPIESVVERVLLRHAPRDRNASRHGRRIRMRCPNPEHVTRTEEEGGTPSFYVNIDGRHVGRGTCYGCGLRTTWSELVTLLGLPREVRFLAIEQPGDLFTDDTSAMMLGAVEATRDLGTMPWPVDRAWRSINGRLINAMGGALVPSRRGETLLRLPAPIRGRMNYIDCTLERNPDGLSYRNADGPWSKHGLFPYDFVRARDPRMIIVTEGVRDPLRCIQNGAMSVSTLGSNGWTEITARLLQAIGAEMVVIMADPDDAGEKLATAVYRDAKEFALVRTVWLPSRLAPHPRTNEMVRTKIVDPADLARGQLHRALAMVGVVKDEHTQRWRWT